MIWISARLAADGHGQTGQTMGAASCTEKCSWSPSCDRDGGVYLDFVTVSWWKAMKKCRKNARKVWLKFEKWIKWIFLVGKNEELEVHLIAILLLDLCMLQHVRTVEISWNPNLMLTIPCSSMSQTDREVMYHYFQSDLTCPLHFLGGKLFLLLDTITQSHPMIFV